MARAKKQTDAPHARIYYDWFRLPAWRTLSPLAAKALVVIVGHYRPLNPYARWSVRSLADAIGCGKSAAAAALDQLEDRGWIVPIRRGRLGMRDATIYRLTMHPLPEEGLPATFDFASWQPMLEPPRKAPPAAPTVRLSGRQSPERGTLKSATPDRRPLRPRTG